MRRAQSTLEYAFLIGIVACAVIAMLVYMKRGFQGNLRQLSEQVGAGYYDPQNTSLTSIETKRTQATLTSSSAESTSTNIESGTETTTRDSTERIGNLSSDTWN